MQHAGASERPHHALLHHASGQLTSCFKGVSWSKGACKWQSQIKHNNVKVFLGLFNVEAEAAAAYDNAALLLKGKEAKGINFPLSNYLDGDGSIIVDQGIKERLMRKRFVPCLICVDTGSCLSPSGMSEKAGMLLTSRLFFHLLIPLLLVPHQFAWLRLSVRRCQLGARSWIACSFAEGDGLCRPCIRREAAADVQLPGSVVEQRGKASDR